VDVALVGVAQVFTFDEANILVVFNTAMNRADLAQAAILELNATVGVQSRSTNASILLKMSRSRARDKQKR
jgi:hypothetical protein